MADGVAAPHLRWTIAPYFIVDDVVSTANYDLADIPQPCAQIPSPER